MESWHADPKKKEDEYLTHACLDFEACSSGILRKLRMGIRLRLATQGKHGVKSGNCSDGQEEETALHLHPHLH